MGAGRRITRVKTGCFTCKARKVKCDEEKPSCRRCTSTGRTCDGYALPPTAKRASLSPFSTPPPEEHHQSVLSHKLGYYSILDEQHINRILQGYASVREEQFQRTGSIGTCYCSFEFIRISLLDSYARTVTIAQLISAEAQTGDLTLARKKDFLQTYGNSLRSVRSRIEQLMHRGPRNQGTLTTDDVRSTVVALIRLVSVEQMRGRMDLTTMHMNMLTQTVQMFGARFFDDLNAVFDTAGTFLMMRVNGIILPNFMFHASHEVRSVPEIELSALVSLSGPMSSVHGPLQNWYKLLGDFVNFKAERISAMDDPLDENRIRQEEKVQTRLEAWLRFLNSFESAGLVPTKGDITKGETRSRSQCAVMKVHVLAMTVQFLVLKSDLEETSYDRCLPIFRTMLEVLQQVHLVEYCRFTIPWLHTTALSAAFLIAVKCRDPKVRRAAVRWMKDSPPPPVWWHGPRAAIAIAKRIMAVEEVAGDVQAAQDVKSEHRVRSCSFVAHEENHTLDFCYQVTRAPEEISVLSEVLSC